MPPLSTRRPNVEVPDLVRRLCGDVRPRVVRNVTIDGRRTSLRLEETYLSALHDISRDTGIEINELVNFIAACRHVDSLTTAIRIFVLAYWREQAERMKR